MSGKTFIWDLDGTLLDSYGVIVSSLRQTLEELEVPMEEAEIRRRATEGSVSDVVQYASAATGRTFSDIKSRYSEISGGRYLEITAMPHAREALEEAAALGAVHFVYTHRGSTTVPVLEHLGLDRFFQEVVSSLNGFPRKPDPGALLYLLEKHRLDKRRVYYVGDRALDVGCAANAGVQSVLYAPSGAGTADHVIRDLLDIRNLAAEETPGLPGRDPVPLNGLCKGGTAMEQREGAVRLWFDMWLKKEDLGILNLFAQDAVYIESWGPEYHGAERIRHWFREWNSRGTVLQWDIHQFFHKGDQTIVQWHFRNQMNDGRTEPFDGLSLIRWDPAGRICFLQEFGCNESRYDPYRDGPEPRFREGPSAWF